MLQELILRMLFISAFFEHSYSYPYSHQLGRLTFLATYSAISQGKEKRLQRHRRNMRLYGGGARDGVDTFCSIAGNDGGRLHGKSSDVKKKCWFDSLC